MKPHSIDIEKLDGISFTGTSIEIQGAMTVRETTRPLEGVHQSSLFLSLAEGAKLHLWLGRLLQRAREQGLQPPR